MEKKIRLDKYLADMGFGTRTEVKQLLKKGMVVVNGEMIKKPEQKVSKEDEIVVNGTKISYVTYEYLMLHKPAGVVSATEDKRHKTVLDCIKESGLAVRNDLFPVGRLDIDTEGLLLITNDGQLAHQLLSPKKEVEKIYYAKVQGKMGEKEQLQFAQGLDLGDFTSKPAKLTVLQYDENENISHIEVAICEGKFHQVKRMFEAVDSKVYYLKRISMGTLKLDETLPIGKVRSLTEKEIQGLKTGKGKECLLC